MFGVLSFAANTRVIVVVIAIYVAPNLWKYPLRELAVSLPSRRYYRSDSLVLSIIALIQYYTASLGFRNKG